jgi:hypothetical protein
VVDIGAALVDQPAAPPSAAASPSDSAAYVTWDVPAANGSSLVSYRVRGKVDGGAVKDVATVAASATSLRVTQFADGTHLANGHTYAFTVSAVNSVGEGPGTGTGSVIPSTAPPPDQPAAPTATGGVEHLTVTWTAPAGGAPPTGYAVRFRLAGAKAWTCAAVHGMAGGAAAIDTCGTVGGSTKALEATTWPLAMAAGRYQVQVAARGDHGASVWSDSATTTVVALAESFRVSAPILRPFIDGFQDSVDLRVTSNRPDGDAGELRIVNSRGATVRSFKLGLATSQTVRWNGRNQRGAVVPYAAYHVIVLLHGRGTAPAALPQRPLLTVAATQASKPSIRLSSSSVFPYPDGYRDSITITSSDAVPSVMTWRVVRNGRTYWTAAWSRRLVVAHPYDGTRSGRRLLPAGRYTLIVSARAGEGVTVSSTTAITVVGSRVQRRAFSETAYALTAMQDAVGNHDLPGAWGRRGVALPDQSQATFARGLPTTVLPYRTVRVTLTSSGDLGGGHVGHAVPLGGYFTGNPLDPSSFGQATVLAVGRTTLPPASPAEIAGGIVRWYVANNALSIDGSTSSRWVVVSFTVTGYRYVLV